MVSRDAATLGMIAYHTENVTLASHWLRSGNYCFVISVSTRESEQKAGRTKQASISFI